jgi:hypothetical protein
MGELRIIAPKKELLLDQFKDKFKKGDSKIIWDPDNSAEVKAARAQFDILKKEGFKAFDVTKSGEKGKEIKKFNNEAGKIIMVPPIAGG